MTIPGCPPPELLEEVARLAPEDPRRRHLDDCPRCRAHWTALQAFLSTPPVPDGARREEAHARLVGALRAEAGIPGAAATTGSRRPSRMQARGLAWLAWRPAVGLASAAVLLAVGLRVVADRREARELVLRGQPVAGRLAGAPIAGPAAHGGLELRWRAVPGADAYRVILYRASLEEIARREAGRDTVLVLAPEELAALGPAGSPLCWRITALRGGDPLSLSPPATLRLP